ncbi:MAG: hypothetical protein CENE_03187 [Candidatus Celerinatantimonas neptuna]|nr:MAG: hypothetical protein CENE_03187 [Candidatus Celerinatantimonas neptuna]
MNIHFLLTHFKTSQQYPVKIATTHCRNLLITPDTGFSGRFSVQHIYSYVAHTSHDPKGVAAEYLASIFIYRCIQNPVRLFSMPQ